MFDDKIMLGELGEILESREEVMRLQLFDRGDGPAVYLLRGEVYLRGTAVTHYAHNEWSSPRKPPRCGDGSRCPSRRSRP